jgi:predicted acylesterase/phospholipase RssA
MTIKRLVLSGGGPIGLAYLGALEYLHDEGFWKLDEIESIYATSIGTIVTVVLCLNFDWETVNTYFIDRPWNDLYKLTAKQIMDVYTKKGLFDITYLDKTLKPLLEAKDLSLTVTLKEFYEYTKKDLFFYAFDLNSYSTIEFSHKTHPDLLLTKAVYMSSSIPGIFEPTFLDDKCIIDGAPLANFPINYCLRDYPEKDEILGFNFISKKDENIKYSNNSIIKNESNMLDFILSILSNSINYITNSIKDEVIPNIIEVTTETGSNNMDDINKCLDSSEHRKSLFDMGIEYAKKFIEKHRLLNKIKIDKTDETDKTDKTDKTDQTDETDELNETDEKDEEAKVVNTNL